MRFPLALSILVALAGCSKPDEAPSPTKDTDPAVTAALNDPLMTDPLLEQRSNRDTLKPADEPVRAMIPLGQPSPLRGDLPPTIAARALDVLATPAFAGCAPQLRYSYGWAARLPGALTLPADARVAEAAGSDTQACALRLVAFDSATPPDKLAETYRATSGYTTDRTAAGEAIRISGTANNGAAFVATIFAARGGSSVDLVANRGR